MPVLAEETWPSGTRRPRMEGRVVFVTGGTQGIGAAIARSFAEQGAVVAAGYGQNRQQAQHLLDQLERHGVEASLHQGNTGSAEDCRRTIGEVIEAHGRLDVLVNHAVDLSGALCLSRAVLPHMIERGSGRIVNVSAAIDDRGRIGQASYAASRSGLVRLTKTLAQEACGAPRRPERLSEDGVGLTVNAVAPGYIATEVLEQVPERVLERIKAQIPVGRLGRPDDVARVVHFLASDHSSFITGAVWDVNGGQDM